MGQTGGVGLKSWCVLLYRKCYLAVSVTNKLPCFQSTGSNGFQVCKNNTGNIGTQSVGDKLSQSWVEVHLVSQLYALTTSPFYCSATMNLMNKEIRVKTTAGKSGMDL
jgi:hypothetical protein